MRFNYPDRFRTLSILLVEFNRFPKRFAGLFENHESKFLDFDPDAPVSAKLSQCPFEAGKRIYDRIIIHAIGNPKMAGAPETASGNRQDQLILECPDKFYIIRNRRFGEKINAPAGLTNS